jgi:Ni,Fe-hydrogenase I cytochrome b subunit
MNKEYIWVGLVVIFTLFCIGYYISEVIIEDKFYEKNDSNVIITPEFNIHNPYANRLMFVCYMEKLNIGGKING